MVSPVDEEMSSISPGNALVYAFPPVPTSSPRNPLTVPPLGGPTWEEHEEEGSDRSGLFQGQFHVKGRLLDEILKMIPFGCFLKWWYPTTMGFPTKNDHFGVFWGYHHFRKPPFLSGFFV